MHRSFSIPWITTFKCRASSESHIKEFLSLIESRYPGELFVPRWVAHDLTFGDTTVPGLLSLLTFGVRTLSLEQLRNAIRMIPDAHVMLQTIQPQHLFTGIQDKSLR